jgi:hypothetical protein
MRRFKQVLWVVLIMFYASLTLGFGYAHCLLSEDPYVNRNLRRGMYMFLIATSVASYNLGKHNHK